MLDAQDLQAIAELMDAKISASEARMMAMIDAKLDAKLDEKLDAKLDEKLDAKLAPIKKEIEMLAPIKKEIEKLGPIKEDLEQIKFDLEVVRETTNRLVAWADEVRDALPLPIPKL